MGRLRTMTVDQAKTPGQLQGGREAAGLARPATVRAGIGVADAEVAPQAISQSQVGIALQVRADPDPVQHGVWAIESLP